MQNNIIIVNCSDKTAQEVIRLIREQEDIQSRDYDKRRNEIIEGILETIPGRPEYIKRHKETDNE